MITIKRGRFPKFILYSGLLGLSLTGCAPCFCDHYLFSEVEGVVTNKGKPITNVEVEQFYFSRAHQKEPTINKTKTDANGKFHFPAASQYVMFEQIGEPFIEQQITIRYANSEIQAWGYAKHNYKNNGELDKPMILKCDVTSENVAKETYLSEAAGVCEFN